MKKGFPWKGLAIGLAVGVVLVLTTGCSGPGVSGHNTIKVINATKGFSKDGLVENMYNCAKDALDTSNRGSGCHRSR
tara:strand:- start:353 stop:583 length:231 start_codon:yes stop_codon:yes gene_type:complete